MIFCTLLSYDSLIGTITLLCMTLSVPQLVGWSVRNISLDGQKLHFHASVWALVCFLIINRQFLKKNSIIFVHVKIQYCSYFAFKKRPQSLVYERLEKRSIRPALFFTGSNDNTCNKLNNC